MFTNKADVNTVVIHIHIICHRIYFTHSGPRAIYNFQFLSANYTNQLFDEVNCNEIGYEVTTVAIYCKNFLIET